LRISSAAHFDIKVRNFQFDGEVFSNIQLWKYRKDKNNESVGLLTSPVNWIRFEIMVNTYE